MIFGFSTDCCGGFEIILNFFLNSSFSIPKTQKENLLIADFLLKTHWMQEIVPVKNLVAIPTYQVKFSVGKRLQFLLFLYMCEAHLLQDERCVTNFLQATFCVRKMSASRLRINIIFNIL